jgi:hypothetical protein
MRLLCQCLRCADDDLPQAVRGALCWLIKALELFAKSRSAVRLFAVQTNARTENVDMRNCCLVPRHQALEARGRHKHAHEPQFPRACPQQPKTRNAWSRGNFPRFDVAPNCNLHQPYFDTFVA